MTKKTLKQTRPRDAIDENAVSDPQERVTRGVQVIGGGDPKQSRPEGGTRIVKRP